MRHVISPRLGRILAALALSATGALGLSGVASGAPSSSSVGVVTSSGPTSALHGPKHHKPKTYAQLLAHYNKTLKGINKRFGRKLGNAMASYRRALAHASSAQDKIDARAAYRQAIVAATNERELELETLGSRPERHGGTTTSVPGTDSSGGDTSSSGSGTNTDH